MVSIECLTEVSDGLIRLMQKFEKNNRQGDLVRLRATARAHKALRKIILFMEIHGDLFDISPLKQGTQYGWVVTKKNRDIQLYLE